MRVILVLLTGLLSLPLWAKTDTVHVVFKTHLDLGFTDFASDVVGKYMNEYIPKAIVTARLMENDGNRKFIWTTGSWILSEYLEKTAPDKRKELESAINAGLICWNAYPFTSHNELMDSALFRFALGVTERLDKRFDKQTIAANITDVPGETIGTLEILRDEGIRLLHIGINPASTRPETPPVFLWKDPDGCEVIVIYDDDYGGTLSIPGFNHILHFEFTGDNEGPPTPEKIKACYQKMNARFPGAVIMASNLNDYALRLWEIRDRLPVIKAELGNTWIHCAGSDPKKYSGMRTLMRLRSKWLDEKKIDPDTKEFNEFSTYLLLLTEHTGGLDETGTLDHDHYSVDELASVLQMPEYQRMIRSWNDCREYIDNAVMALGNTSLSSEAKLELAKLEPQRPDLNGFKSFPINEELQTDHFIVRFDPNTGAICSLYDSDKDIQLCNELVPVGLFWHESFSEEDYQRWADQYLRLRERWVTGDFLKPNANSHGAVSAKRLPEVAQALIKQNSEGINVLFKLELKEDIPVKYGLPAEVWMNIEFPEKFKEIKYTIEWFGKKATRLPEAYWFSSGFPFLKAQGWKIEKINKLISPLDVVPKGGRNLHAFNRGIFYNDGEYEIFIESPDCPIVAPESPSLLDFNDQLPDMTKGWHFNLFNNKWGTNFPTWYSDDTKFRFIFHFD